MPDTSSLDGVDDAITLLQDHSARHAHDETVRRHLAHLGILQRRITELRQAGDAEGRETLADILADRGRTETLRLAADARDPATHLPAWIRARRPTQDVTILQRTLPTSDRSFNNS